MVCEVHPENETIGICASCGRGVCKECKESHDDIIHCKECITAGRIVDKPSLDWQSYFYYLPHKGAPNPGAAMRAGLTMPYPAEDPESRSFKIGQYGCITAGIVSLIVPFLLFDLTAFSYMLFGGNILIIVAYMPFIMGLYGIYRNYGPRSVMAASVSLILLLLLYVVLSLVDYIQYCRAEDGLCTSWNQGFFLGILMVAIGNMMTGYALYSVSGFFVRASKMKQISGTAALGFLAGGCLMLFFLMSLSTFPLIGGNLQMGILSLGWVVVGMSLFLMTFFFRYAPLPERYVDKIADDDERPIKD